MASSVNGAVILCTGIRLWRWSILVYLEAKGIKKFAEIDSDPKAQNFMPERIADKFILEGIWTEIEG